jgi:hypothetical protein
MAVAMSSTNFACDAVWFHGTGLDDGLFYGGPDERGNRESRSKEAPQIMLLVDGKTEQMSSTATSIFRARAR